MGDTEDDNTESLLGSMAEQVLEEGKRKAGELAQRGREKLSEYRETADELRQQYEDDPEAFEEEAKEYLRDRASEARERGSELLGAASKRAVKEVMLRSDDMAQSIGYTDAEEVRQELGVSDPEIDAYLDEDGASDLPDDLNLDSYDGIRTETLEMDPEARDYGTSRLAARKAEAYMRENGLEGVEFVTFKGINATQVKIDFWTEKETAEGESPFTSGR